MEVIDQSTGEVVQRVSATAVEAITKAEIDVQIATAKQYPRSVTQFKETVRDLACLDEETASECFYSLTRKGKSIIGPSARFAEVVAMAWGNCRASARIVDESDEFVTAQGVCHDLERNIAVSTEVRRRITDRNGRKFGADMIGVTANAASAIALRNAVLKVVPKAYWSSAWKEAMNTSLGRGRTISSMRESALKYFRSLNVSDARITAAVGVASMDDIGTHEITVLRGVANAIKEGETTIEDAFPNVAPTGTSDLDAAREQAKAKTEGPPLPEITEPVAPAPVPEPNAPTDAQTTDSLSRGIIAAAFNEHGVEKERQAKIVSSHLELCEVKRWGELTADNKRELLDAIEAGGYDPPAEQELLSEAEVDEALGPE